MKLFNKRWKIALVIGTIGFGIVLLATCTTHKNAHTKSYGKMKNKSIKVKHNGK